VRRCPGWNGRLKVTGKALYAAEHDVNGAVHAVIVDASIGGGCITGIDPRAAEAQQGVLKAIHYRNAPTLPYRDNSGSNNPEGRRLGKWKVSVTRELSLAALGKSDGGAVRDHVDPRAGRPQEEPGLQRRLDPVIPSTTRNRSRYSDRSTTHSCCLSGPDGWALWPRMNMPTASVDVTVVPDLVARGELIAVFGCDGGMPTSP